MIVAQPSRTWTLLVRRLPVVTAIATMIAAQGASSQPAEAGVERYTVAPTVSPAAQAQLTAVYRLLASRPARIKPASLAAWDQQRDQAEALFGPRVRQVADGLDITATAEMIGGVAVVRVRPAKYRPSGRTLLYLHGGGYTLFSAATTLIVPALLAARSGDEVISIDYTLAPRGTWRVATDEVLAVWRALLASGVPPRTIGLLGDSAGGGLAAGSVLKMRDAGLPLPGALWLLSPWADITATGDSYLTLATADPLLDPVGLSWSAEAYAAPDEQRNPYVSPVYGDYSKPFPPTLIQAGTRELFLSHAVRQYQAIRGGGHDAVLDLYEGMPHVFQSLAPNAPETHTAVDRAAVFFHERLAVR